ncbi:peptidylprolyl isomerase [Sphingomonas sp. HT-1]|uniref:peptidylprolyl isomerase n=1 Tax=unclassified Sphingomonas TaxID=196159 RepID=UPI00031B4C23|nr:MULTISPECIES: peptidylprolyl isomerase [unclassified Sphingomonas]KTF70833.1 peptidylprolyl isomerase [Sphingomonas sp. WG]
MRFLATLAAMAATLFAVPALAQGGGKPQPVIEPFRGVNADAAARPSVLVQADPENTWVLDLSTGGRVLIRLRPDVAPKMVERIKTLTRRHFYDGLTFHRVVDDPYNIAQGGDPKGDGTGDSDLPNVPAEFSSLPHVRGSVSAARRGAPDNATPEQKTEAENSANSQFFIMMQPKLAFDHDYTVFGRVISGMEWVDKIQRGEPPQNPTVIVHAYIQSDNPPPYQPLAPTAPAAAAPMLLPETPAKPPVKKPVPAAKKPAPKKK